MVYYIIQHACCMMCNSLHSELSTFPEDQKLYGSYVGAVLHTTDERTKEGNRNGTKGALMQDSYMQHIHTSTK
jgi:hypothetical protein